MIVLQIIIGVIAAVGVGFLLADLMKIPSLKASKAANSVGRKGKKKTGVIELYRRDFATKLAGKLHLNEFKRANLVIDLRTANMEITPEQYMADAIVKALMIGILAIPAFDIYNSRFYFLWHTHGDISIFLASSSPDSARRFNS